MLNSAAQLGSYGLNSVLGAFVSVMVIRHLGRVEYGTMAFVVAYVSFFRMLTSMGTDIVLVREVARRPNDASDLVGGALSLRLALSVGVMVLVWAVLPVVTWDLRIIALAVVYSLSFLFSYSGLYLVLFNVELRSHIPNSVLAVWSFACSAIRVGLVTFGGRVVLFLAAEVVAVAGSLVLSRWVSRRYSRLRPSFRIDMPLWQRLLREGWPMAVGGSLVDLHMRVDQMLIFRWSGAAELGGYAAAVRVSEIWGVIATALVSSLFPLLSRYAEERDGLAERVVTRAYRYLYIIICPIAVLLVMYASSTLLLLFGPAFVEGAGALSLLAIAEIFVFSNALTYNVLFSLNRQGQAALLASVSLMTNVGLNCWLIPVKGGAGAAAASLVSYAVVPLLMLSLPGARWVGTKAIASLARPVLSAFITVCVLWTIEPELLVGVLLVAIVYPVTLLAVRGVDRSDVDIISRVVLTR